MLWVTVVVFVGDGAVDAQWTNSYKTDGIRGQGINRGSRRRGSRNIVLDTLYCVTADIIMRWTWSFRIIMN